MTTRPHRTRSRWGFGSLDRFQMPLAPHPGGVAGIGESPRGRDLPSGQAVGATGDRHCLCARPDRVAARQDRRPARGALCLYIEIQQPQTLGGEPVDPWRRRTAQHASAVAADLPPSEVVPEEHHDVRLVRAHTHTSQIDRDGALATLANTVPTAWVFDPLRCRRWGGRPRRFGATSARRCAGI